MDPLALGILMMTAVIVLCVALAYVTRRLPKAVVTEAAATTSIAPPKKSDNDCKVCRAAPAYHRPSMIIETRGWHAAWRRSMFAPPMYKRLVDTEASPAYCEHCVLDIDAMDDAAIAERRRIHAGMFRETTNAIADHMKNRDDRARRQLRGETGNVVRLAVTS